MKQEAAQGNLGTSVLQGREHVSEHTGLPVAGYLPQSTAKVDLVNVNKDAEERVLRILDHLATLPDTDKRWLAIGRTAIENGWMAVNRSVFKPARVPVAGDP
jgi:hypothetical protein